MKKTFITIFTIIASFSILSAQTARLQVIHNSADPAADTVDIYVNGAIFIDDFVFRTSTPFQDVPANTALSIAVAPANSTSVGDAIVTIPIGSLMAGETYVLFANGIVSGGFDPNPDGIAIGFDLYPFAPARESAANPSNVELLVFHGATDAPVVDVLASTGGGAASVLIDNLAYSSFQGYASVPPAEYVLEITDSSGSSSVASYVADVSALAGGAAVVYASGFLNSAQGPAFGLYVAFANGGPSAQLPAYVPTGIGDYINNVKQVNIYPNPASETLTLEIDLEMLGDLNIQIYNSIGSLMKSMESQNLFIGKNTFQIDITEFSKGSYHIQLTSENDGKVSYPFIVK